MKQLSNFTKVCIMLAMGLGLLLIATSCTTSSNVRPEKSAFVRAKVHRVLTREEVMARTLPVYEVRVVNRMFRSGDIIKLDNVLYQIDSLAN